MKYIVFTIDDCKWCDKAKALLTINDKSFSEIKMGRGPHASHMEATFFQLWKDMGFKTAPQVFKGPHHIGGYEDLVRHLNS